MTQTFFMTEKTTCKYRLTTTLFLEMPNDWYFRIGTEKSDDEMWKFFWEIHGTVLCEFDPVAVC